MTIPYLQNCAHSDSGWCLECTRRLGEENELLLMVVNSSNAHKLAFEALKKANDLNDELQREREESVKTAIAIDKKCREAFERGKEMHKLYDDQVAELGRLRKFKDNVTEEARRIIAASDRLFAEIWGEEHTRDKP